MNFSELSFKAIHTALSIAPPERIHLLNVTPVASGLAWAAGLHGAADDRARVEVVRIRLERELEGHELKHQGMQVHVRVGSPSARDRRLREQHAPRPGDHRLARALGCGRAAAHGVGRVLDRAQHACAGAGRPVMARPVPARVTAMLGLLVLAGTARAATTVDLIEHLFGASNVNGVVGNGRLTVGISALGDGVVVSWPSPSYCDQVLHLGDNDLEVRARRNLAVADSMGTFIGVRVTIGGETTVHFPRVDWQVTQSFPEAASARMRTVFAKAGVPFTVEVEDAVAQDADVWQRRVRVVPAGGTTLEAVEVLGYWNLSPTSSRVPQPLADWVLDAFNDYAALWSEAGQRIVHFRPTADSDIDSIAELIARPALDYGPVGDALAAGPVDAAKADALVQGLAGEGVYLTIASDQPIVGHQVGFDDTPICELVDGLADHIKALPDAFPGLTLPLDPALVDVLRCTVTPESLVAGEGWVVPTAAYSDLQDGVLKGANAAAGQVDTALVVTAARDGEAFTATFRLAAGKTLAAATAAAAGDAGQVLTVDARLPDRSGSRRGGDARAAEPAAGAGREQRGDRRERVAARRRIALDWPVGDGAFFTAALDVAGLTGRASARVPFVLSAQRLEAVAAEPIINSAPPPDPTTGASDAYPAGAWEMNYYADGRVGGNIRWEINNTALVVWSLVDHGRYLETAAREVHRGRDLPGGRACGRPADALEGPRDGAASGDLGGRQRRLHADAARGDHHLGGAERGAWAGAGAARPRRERARAAVGGAGRGAAPGNPDAPRRRHDAPLQGGARRGDEPGQRGGRAVGVGAVAGALPEAVGAGGGANPGRDRGLVARARRGAARPEERRLGVRGEAADGGRDVERRCWAHREDEGAAGASRDDDVDPGHARLRRGVRRGQSGR